MFNPLENEASEAWFQRLNAPLKRLPAEERAALHVEVRQHLEALAAANEELGSSLEEAWDLARTQFGDPGKFGRKMRREAHAPSRDPNQWSKNPLTAAAMYTFFQCLILAGAMQLFMLLADGTLLLIAPALPVNDPWNNTLGTMAAGFIVGGAVSAGLATGLRMKQKAVLGTFCGLLPGLAAVLSISSHDPPFVIMMLMGLAEGCLASWVGAKLRQARERKSVTPAQINP